MLRLTLALLALLAISPAAKAEKPADQTTCEKVEGARPYGYCITVTPGSKNQDVLYVLHGGGGDENWWSQDPALDDLKKIWREGPYGMPRVVEISFGQIWILAPQGKSPESGLMEVFTDEIMPKLEAKLAGKINHRKILGHSMGGLNGALLLLHRPDLFKAAALMAPAFLGISPFSDAAVQAEYEKSRGMQPGWMKNVMAIARHYVVDDEEWSALSPTLVAPDALSPDSPDILVSVGSQDPMFYGEAKLFAAQAKKAGTFTVLDDHGQGHGYVSSGKIARFLSLPF